MGPMNCDIRTYGMLRNQRNLFGWQDIVNKHKELIDLNSFCVAYNPPIKLAGMVYTTFKFWLLLNIIITLNKRKCSKTPN